MKKDQPKKVQRIYEAGFKIAVARAYLESKLLPMLAFTSLS
jgi:hypothetical protein